MPIKGLSDRGASFPLLGYIAKGERGQTKVNRKGKEYQELLDLNHFRLRGANGRSIAPDLAADFNKVYGEKPGELFVKFPFNTVEENFPTWLEEWNDKCLKYRCDGEQLHIIDHKKADRFADFVPCVRAQNKQCECKEVGRLNLLLPAIKRVGFFQLVTHSIHDIKNLSEQLRAIELSVGSLRGIDFVLRRCDREISCPFFKEGKEYRKRQTKSLLQIEAVFASVEQRLFAMAEPVAILPEPQKIAPRLSATPSRPALTPAPTPAPDTQTGEINLTDKFWSMTDCLGYTKEQINNWLAANFQKSLAEMSEQEVVEAIALVEKSF